MIDVTAVAEDQTVDVPVGIGNLESFLRWAETDEFPESGRICYLKSRVWVDMSMEEMNHNQLTGLFTMVLGDLIVSGRLGRYFHDGMVLSNIQADLSVEPDGMFLSRKRLRSGKARLVMGKGTSPIRVEGTPDMALEVVSPSSVQKETVDLRQLYWEAGIPEYWLVNPLEQRLTFEILRSTPKEYVPVSKQAGWLKSTVFGKSFKLTQRRGKDGYPEYRLLAQ
jgi:Uma2 family endonuclease